MSDLLPSLRTPADPEALWMRAEEAASAEDDASGKLGWWMVAALVSLAIWAATFWSLGAFS